MHVLPLIILNKSLHTLFQLQILIIIEYTLLLSLLHWHLMFDLL